MNTMRKYAVIGLVVVLLFLTLFIWWRYYFVFGEGVKAGELNYFVKKGYVFKSYEGKLIQSGFKSAIPGSVQSNEFQFSVGSDAVAKQLERCSGKTVELRYKEYLNPLPWRGMTNYEVIEVLKVEE